MKKAKKFFEYYVIPPFNTGIIICCLSKESDVVIELNKKENKKISNWLKTKTLNYESISYDDDSSGCVFKRTKDDYPLIFFIKQDNLDDMFLSTIVHETNHLVKLYSRFFGFTEELEFNAYLQQYLFQIIKDRLYK